jgi:hypothetical protein
VAVKAFASTLSEGIDVLNAMDVHMEKLNIIVLNVWEQESVYIRSQNKHVSNAKDQVSVCTIA